jgi:preprotein translocase subunit SecF
MLNNERTNIRTIVKWSKEAIIVMALTVLLVVGVFVQKAHAEAIRQQKTYQVQLQESQAKTSKIESNLKTVQTEKQQLAVAVSEKDARIQQLEQENADLK